MMTGHLRESHVAAYQCPRTINPHLQACVCVCVTYHITSSWHPTNNRSSLRWPAEAEDGALGRQMEQILCPSHRRGAGEST